MRSLALCILFVFACGDDSEPSEQGGGVAGLWAWCDHDADDDCATLDNEGWFFTGGRTLDASYNAAASTYCTYEEVGTYEVQGTTVVITDAEDGTEETYTMDGSFLRGSTNDLKRVQATPAPRATCPH
jgi:hypothetical protein